MNIKTILLLTVGILWSTTVSYAQKVSATTNNAQIDCREIKGVSNATKGLTNTSTLTAVSVNDSEYTSEKSNEQIFHWFEVAQNDASSGEKSWLDALARCRELEGGSGKWRLPTYRELILIMVMSPELQKTGKFTPLEFENDTKSYWSATVANATQAWTVRTNLIGFSDRGITGENPPNKVRCIRELPL